MPPRRAENVPRFQLVKIRRTPPLLRLASLRWTAYCTIGCQPNWSTLYRALGGCLGTCCALRTQKLAHTKRRVSKVDHEGPAAHTLKCSWFFKGLLKVTSKRQTSRDDWRVLNNTQNLQNACMHIYLSGQFVIPKEDQLKWIYCYLCLLMIYCRSIHGHLS